MSRLTRESNQQRRLAATVLNDSHEICDSVMRMGLKIILCTNRQQKHNRMNPTCDVNTQFDL